jgi:uncharacterized protein YpmS
MWKLLSFILCSLLIIFGFHFLWDYLKDTYTTKKTKDLVGTQTEKYKQIVNDLLDKKNDINANTTCYLNDEEKEKMNTELLSMVM